MIRLDTCSSNMRYLLVQLGLAIEDNSGRVWGLKNSILDNDFFEILARKVSSQSPFAGLPSAEYPWKRVTCTHVVLKAEVAPLPEQPFVKIPSFTARQLKEIERAIFCCVRGYESRFVGMPTPLDKFLNLYSQDLQHSQLQMDWVQRVLKTLGRLPKIQHRDSRTMNFHALRQQQHDASSQSGSANAAASQPSSSSSSSSISHSSDPQPPQGSPSTPRKIVLIALFVLALVCAAALIYRARGGERLLSDINGLFRRLV